MESANVWEDLRKQARSLEIEIDSKLATLNRWLGGKIGMSDFYRSEVFVKDQSDSQLLQPLLATSASFETLCTELDQLFIRLGDVNDRMTQWISSFARSPSPAVLHTVQRHRDILRDYITEFNKSRNIIKQRLQRDELMSSVEKDLQSLKSNNNNGLSSRRTDLYLKENEHIRSSDRLLDDSISIAMNTKEHLTQQHGGLKSVSRKLQILTKKYPAINSVMQKIQIKKRRDMLVLGIVIFICMVLLFLYAMH